MGGKAKIGREIARVIRAESSGDRYLEPFLGAGSVCAAMASHYRIADAGDAHPDLILMWQELMAGWIPPAAVSEATYQALRGETPSALRGFVGFGLSFGGIWFSGYARNARGDDYCGAARRGLLRRVDMMRHVSIRCADYRTWEPGPGTVVYCDPPYCGTAAFSTGKFESDEFWETCKQWSFSGAEVFVSEYTPHHYGQVVWKRDRTTSLNRNDGTATEYLIKVSAPH